MARLPDAPSLAVHGSNQKLHGPEAHQEGPRGVAGEGDEGIEGAKDPRVVDRHTQDEELA